ncbi:MAG: ATP-dependent chaperone ClpB, partial [Rhodospirillaceae bacterium]|nr:ATP-dependent chaperone ClpB [Rhodospirillaceae bacterium]
EFLNRLDEILLFHRLAPEHMAGIVTNQLLRLDARLKDRELTLEVTEAARQWLAERGYDPVYGARPLKRLIQRTLENPLAMCLLEGHLTEGDSVKVDADVEGLTIAGRAASAWLE